MAKILHGKEVALAIEKKLELRIGQLTNPLTLGIIQVGDNPSSNTYIAQKTAKAHKLGIQTKLEKLPENTTIDELVRVIIRFNLDQKVNGFIVQLPLPDHIKAASALSKISPKKDVDALSPLSMGLLMHKENKLLPATTRGILSLLDHYKIVVKGKHVVIIGRSTLVGKPTALSLLNLDATITIAHSHSRDLTQITQSADIIISAAGQPNLINQDLIKPGSIIVDVGITPTEDGLKGDVDLASVERIAQALSPVPGGVGPLTVISLFENLVDLHVNRGEIERLSTNQNP